ncbi:hypothetical protein BKA82DRAFT_3976473 [Pisolithus tinctorius]|nr:hypothetical protein BKA82DRAFT_3976473 [Pisolithus tinctorius]
MAYSVPLIIFMDDVSGNISKQWNKHHAVYMSNANLPCKMIEKEFCIQFVSASLNATPMELMRAVKESLCKAADTGIVAWDCKGEEEVLLILRACFLAGDNPMQAEECSHTGLKCNYFCRTCNVGGTQLFKLLEQGYNSIFVVSKLCMPEETTTEVCQQVQLSLQSGATEKLKVVVAEMGVCDSSTTNIINVLIEMRKKLCKQGTRSHAMPEADLKARLQKELEDYLQGGNVKDVINPLLSIKGFNIHLDTPMEILHTILLGIVKYFWAQTVLLLEKAKLLNTFETQLDSLETDGLNSPCLTAGYICHYKGGLNGKHFKSLAQVMPFLIHDLVSKVVLDGWTIIGELVVLIWHTQIDNTESYLVIFFHSFAWAC